jgi:hypothetical protein
MCPCYVGWLMSLEKIKEVNTVHHPYAIARDSLTCGVD